MTPTLPSPADLRAPLDAWTQSADPAYCRTLDGRILCANLSFARKFGRLPMALPETPVTELVHADDVAALAAANEKLSRASHHAAEHRWLTPQGVRWLAWEETALRDATGAFVAVRAIGRDITLQRLAQEQFYRLSRAIEQSPVATAITDLEGRAQYVNGKFTEVTGYTLEQILDRNIAVLRDGHADAASFEACWSTIRAGGEWRGELCTTRNGQGTVWESVKVSCLRGASGEITNFLCLREDITERKRLESQLRQAQKMESLGTLAGGIAHDFNNLVAIILGYAEFCQAPEATAAVREKGLREIQCAAERARSMIRQILTFSRKAEVRFAPVDLNQLLRDLAALLAETFPRNVTFQFSLQPDLPPLLADASQLQQVILNLCVNARDAMPAGGTITMSTSLRPGHSLPPGAGTDPAKDYAWLQISDSGAGMTPAVRQRIFEPFFTTKPATKGTGLGLAVVYGIVVAHHGAIEVDSAPGRGSTFHVFLPLSGNAVLNHAPVATNEFPCGTESVLVVDDEESLRTLVSIALSSRGYRVTTAASGLEAIELLGEPTRAFDAVLLDLNMPGATGVDVLKVIRCSRPGLKVIVLSGHVSAETRTELEGLGHRDWIQKPCSLAQLGRRLRKLLDAPAIEAS